MKKTGHASPKKTSSDKQRSQKQQSPASSPRPGEHTLAETLSQPAIWTETVRQLERQGTLKKLGAVFSSRRPWLMVACGSSYYLAQVVAALWAKYFHIPCTVVPASELLFAPEEILRNSGAEQIVLTSRSGETTEVLRVGELLQSHGNIVTLGVTCNTAGALEKLCNHTLKLPWADEKSMVMTRSFTAMLLMFQRLGARVSGNTQLASVLDHIPEKAQQWLDSNADKIRAFGAKRKFADYVFLGQGAHYWLAQEAALKITEMSSSYAQAYYTLEFRHGPRSIASRDTLITFLISDAAAAEETLIVNELKQLGAATFVITNRATPALQRCSDLLISLDMDEPEFARFPVTAIPAHLLGAAIGVRKGLNPDAPKNLTRAVVLGSNGSDPISRSDT